MFLLCILIMCLTTVQFFGCPSKSQFETKHFSMLQNPCGLWSVCGFHEWNLKCSKVHFRFFLQKLAHCDSAVLGRQWLLIGRRIFCSSVFLVQLVNWVKKDSDNFPANRFHWKRPPLGLPSYLHQLLLSVRSSRLNTQPSWLLLKVPSTLPILKIVVHVSSFSKYHSRLKPMPLICM